MSEQGSAGERFIIGNGTPVIGGLFLSRVGIVVDADTNPDPYTSIVSDVASDVERSRGYMDVNAYNIANMVNNITRKITPLEIPKYPDLLKVMAYKRGKEHLDPSDEIPLSSFMDGPCICHQSTLLEAAVLELLDREGIFQGEVNISTRWTHPSLENPDRHIQTVLLTDEPEAPMVVLDAASGVNRYRIDGQPILGY